jgi:hypothetical protein
MPCFMVIETVARVEHVRYFVTSKVSPSASFITLQAHFFSAATFTIELCHPNVNSFTVATVAAVAVAVVASSSCFEVECC